MLLALNGGGAALYETNGSERSSPPQFFVAVARNRANIILEER